MSLTDDPIASASGFGDSDPVISAGQPINKRGGAPMPIPGVMARVGRGMMDVYQGAKQKALGLIDPARQQAYTDEINHELALYEQGRAAGGGGMDVARFVGNIATPLSAIPGGAATLAGRAVLGAVAGGLGGYTSFNPRNTGASSAMSAGIGAIGGAALNAAAPPVIRGVVAAVQGLKNKLVGSARSAAQSLVPDVQIINELRVSLAREGVDWSALPKEIQASTLQDAKAYLSTTGKLDPQALARKADIESIVGPGGATRAQITASPQDWSIAGNLQKTEVNIPAVQRGDVPTLTGKLSAQNDARTAYAAALESKVGGGLPAQARSATPFQSGERVIEAVKKAYSNLGEQVSEAYTLARRHIGAQSLLPRDMMDARMIGALADFEDVIPSPIQSRLAQFGITKTGHVEAARLLTVDEGDKLLKLINKRYGSADAATRAGLDEIRGALKESVLSLAKSGNKGAQKFQDAWSAAAGRFGLFDPKPLAAIVGDKADPSRVFQQYVIGGNPNDLAAVIGVLNENGGAAVVADLKAQVIRYITDQATSKGLAPLDGTRLSKALDKIGTDRIKILFTPDEIAQMETLRRGSLAMTREPPLSAVNRSNTTPAALGAMLRLGNRLPIINMVTSPIEGQVQASLQQRALQRALYGGVDPTAGRSAAQRAFQDRAVGLLGRANYGVPAGALAGLLSQ